MTSSPYSLPPLASRNAAPFVAALPGSKSATNRALLLAAMRRGSTTIAGALRSDDTDRLAAALSAFGGLRVTMGEASFAIERANGPLSAPTAALDLGGSGTGARFLLAFAAAARGATTITGDARLRERPMADVITALAAIGIRCECLERPGCLPVRVHGGAPTTRQWRVQADTSSQFASALLLLASQCAGAEIELRLDGVAVSRPYVELTIAQLRANGIAVAVRGEAIVVTPGVPQRATIAVEPDASSASYLLAAAAITGTTVVVDGLGSASAQGDVSFAALLARMGCTVTLLPDRVTVTGGELRGIDADLGAMPDVALTLAAVAACARGSTRMTNVAHLRAKESDRLSAATAALRAVGAHAEVGASELIVQPAPPLRSAIVRTFADHRVAMAFALLGLRAPGIAVDDGECVRKSWPGYWRELERFAAHHGARA